MKIEVQRGDITNQPDMQAIVNAANTDLVLGAGVAGAIRRKGGDEIESESRAKAPIHLGEAVHTTAGRLPNRFVIHTAAMGYRPEDERVPKRPGSLSSAAIIRDATLNSLRIADELKLNSIALPALATGVGGFPVDECAQAMIVAAMSFRESNPGSSVQVIRFVLFDEHSYHVFQQTLATFDEGQQPMALE